MKTFTAWTAAALIAIAGVTAMAPAASARGWHHGHHGGYHGHHRFYGHRGHYGHYYGGGGFGVGLLSGALIGGALAGPYYDYPPAYRYHRYPAYRTYYPRRHYRVVGRLSRAHVRWCYAHYRSYRASDDTFQPYHGPRRLCAAPY